MTDLCNRRRARKKGKRINPEVLSSFCFFHSLREKKENQSSKKLPEKGREDCEVLRRDILAGRD